MWNSEDGFRVKSDRGKYINVPNIVVYNGEPLFKIKRPDGFLFDATPEQTNFPGENVIKGLTIINFETEIKMN
ncbi:MAG: hypothetical protein ACOCT9_02675 [archaeon]